MNLLAANASVITRRNTEPMRLAEVSKLLVEEHPASVDQVQLFEVLQPRHKSEPVFVDA